MEEKKATIRDVAKKAGVSHGLVSFFLRDMTYRNGGSIGVSEETGRKIIQAARTLNYQPRNLSARLKLYPNCGGMALLIERRAANGFVKFYSELLLGAISGRTADANVNFSVFDTATDYLLQPELLPYCTRDEHTSKFMIVGGENYSLALALKKKNRSVCYLLRSNGLGDTFSIVPDFEDAAFKSVKYLLDNGHRDIAVIGEKYARENLYSHPRIIKGIKRAFKSAGMVFDEEKRLFFNAEDEENPRPTYYREFREKAMSVTAILCLCEYSAVRFSRLAAADGIRIPEDLSLMSFCGKPDERIHDIPVTCMMMPLREIGDCAMTLLDAGNPGEQNEHVIPFRFIEGQTVRNIG